MVGRSTRSRPLHATLAATAAAVAVAVVAGCGIAPTTVAGKGITAPVTEAVKPATPRPATAVGGTAPHRDGALEFVVLDISRTSQVGEPANPGLSMNAKGVFLVATLSIRNLGEVPVTLFDRDQGLTDVTGKTFVPNMAADIYANPNVHSTRIKPGGRLVVRIVFDVPVDTTVPTTLVLRQSSSSPGVAVPLG